MIEGPIAASIRIEEALRRVYEALNASFFAGRLPVVPIERGLPARYERLNGGRVEGCYRVSDARFYGRICLSDRLFSSEADWDLISRVLLHEMTHVDEHREGGRVGAHGPVFHALAARAARQAGWDTFDSPPTSWPLSDVPVTWPAAVTAVWPHQPIQPMTGVLHE